MRMCVCVVMGGVANNDYQTEFCRFRSFPLGQSRIYIYKYNTYGHDGVDRSVNSIYFVYLGPKLSFFFFS